MLVFVLSTLAVLCAFDAMFVAWLSGATPSSILVSGTMTGFSAAFLGGAVLAS